MCEAYGCWQFGSFLLWNLLYAVIIIEWLQAICNLFITIKQY